MKKCGSCKYFDWKLAKDTPDGVFSFCKWEDTAIIPPWASANLRGGSNGVFAWENTDCPCFKVD